MPPTDIRPRYRKIGTKKIASISAIEDLGSLPMKSGLIDEERILSEEVISIHNQVANIKFTNQDIVSNVTNSIFGQRDMYDIDLKSTPEIKQYSTICWNRSAMTKVIQQKPAVQQPSNTNTVDVTSWGIPRVTHR